jgi:hypothetical protein
MLLQQRPGRARLYQGATFWLGLLVLLVAVGSTVMTAVVDQTADDSRATLLVSQTLWRTGTIRLQISAREVRRYSFTVQRKNGRSYGYFPLGSAVLAVPFVAVLDHFNFDVRDGQTDARAQRLLAMGISVLCAALLVAVARLFLSQAWALLVAGVFWFGTSLASTEATALWSHDFGSVFALLAIYLCLCPSSRWPRSAGFLIGGALFVAYFCRPTLSLLAPEVLLYLWFRQRAWVWKCVVTLTAGLLMFVAFSWHEFHQLLPDYYLPERLSNAEFWTALWNNLVGPARGLFVYSPILALPLLFARPAFRGLRSAPWVVLIALCWPITHLIVISRFPHWWAGFSFGARLCTDALPGLFVLLCLTIQEALATWARLLPVAVALLALPSIFINTYQGLYNAATQHWNARPNIDRNPSLLFDWHYPQFLATNARNARRLERFQSQKPAAPAQPSPRRHRLERAPKPE